jgi:hypothetical protein
MIENDPDEDFGVIITPMLEEYLSELGIDFDELMPGTIEWDGAMEVVEAYYRGKQDQAILN